ncbi:hypothetical protein Q670_08160 [Alcanivorax sp. P2S70]|uniref:hypothetical protein n=1 Tax=Alcanivorax sp. P2S70 TaxID=1397527 RepID=UPI0003B61729|nr:hypothetical protein [Alcanivorax sp. P2S70]ERP93013.1 hypothetical protein Q670_08160 [Alcanivorax sp. P2S70]
MKNTTKFIFFLLVALLLSCGGESFLASNDGGISGTGNGGSKSSLAGSAYKGPFIQDSEVNVLKIEGDSSSLIASSQVQANLGDFLLEVEPGLLSVATSGRYYDETEATYSEESITLKALVNKDPEQPALVFVNVLTLLSHDEAVKGIDLGNSYEQATQDAQSKVKTLLAAVTGDIPTSQPFTNMNISNRPGTTAEDNAYALYVSALFSEAVNERRLEEPQYSMATLLNTLRTDIGNGDPIDETTLRSLQEANGRLDAASIQQNLESVLIGQTIAPVGDVIDTVTPGLEPPSNLTTSHNPTAASQQFCFDMTAECTNPEHKAQIVTATGLTYDLQIDDNADFSSPIVDLSGWRRNYYEIEHSSLGSGTRYFRVRKHHDDSQLSLWSETDFEVP